MQVRSNRRLLIPAAVVIGLLVPVAAATSATAASTPKPQRLTGVVQTVIREMPIGQSTTAEDTANATSKVLRVGAKTVPLAEGSLSTTPDGSKVSVTVAAAGDGTQQVLSASTVSAPVAATEAVATQHLYVAVVVPANVAPDNSITDTSVRAMVAKASSYWSSQTGGLVSFDMAQVISYTSSLACANTAGMWNEANNLMPAAAAAHSHLVVIAPNHADDFGCAYGLANIGGDTSVGNEVFVSGLDQSLLAHELGHNLGLNHSNSFRCTSTQDMPVLSVAPAGCEANPYDDLFDVMGFSGLNYGEGSLNAVHLDAMNLLPNAVLKIPAGSGRIDVRLAPLSDPLSSTTTARTLKITDSSGHHYFVEYRTNTGRDRAAGTTGWGPAWGVRVLRDDPAPAGGSAFSYELDATPTSILLDDYNRSLAVGHIFTSASRQLTILVTSQDAGGANVSIYNGVALPAGPSRVTLSIPKKALVGAAITASTRVTDQYGRAKASWVVTLQKMQRGTRTWKSVKALRTNATGAASYRFANGVSGSYRWVSAAATGAPGKVSASVAVTSTARAVEARPVTSMTHGTVLTVHGSVSAVPHPIVYVQYRYGAGAWRTSPRATVTGTKVSVRIRFSNRATVYTRLSIRSATSYTGAVSGAFVTRVR